MPTLPTHSLDTHRESPLHALVRTVLQALHLRPNPASPPAAATDAAPEGFLYEHAFSTEREALAFADGLAAQGYRVEVQHDVYDFSWSVEVFRGQTPAAD